MTDLLTTDEVASMLRLDDPETVRRLARSGRLAAYRVAGKLLFSRAAVARFLDASRVRATPPSAPAPRKKADGSWRRAIQEPQP